MAKVSKKKQALVKILEECEKTGNFIFHNDFVKKVCQEVGFGNPFDATHIDSIDGLPDIYREKDYFIVHLGKGNHKIIKGIQSGYHVFEEIERRIPWPYKPDILDWSNTSESNILSVAYNEGVIKNFLSLQGNGTTEEADSDLKVFNAHRTKYSFEYKIGKEKIKTEKQQIEIDMTVEANKNICIFEAKKERGNKFRADFAVYQIYLPFLYYLEKEKLDVQQINCCYLLQQDIEGDAVIRLYLYKFQDPKNMASIQLERCVEYTLEKSST